MTDDPAMREPDFLILTSLAAHPRQGCAVIEDIELISAGRVVLATGTLDTAIDRLRSDGLIEIDHEELVDSRLRRYYRLTDAGAQHLATEAQRLRRHATAAVARLRRRHQQSPRPGGEPG